MEAQLLEIKIDPYAPIDMGEQGAKINEKQALKRQSMDIKYAKVFGSVEGKLVLADLERRMEEEDIPLYNIQHVNEFMHYSSGRRSIVKYIRLRMNRISKG